MRIRTTMALAHLGTVAALTAAIGLNAWRTADAHLTSAAKREALACAEAAAMAVDQDVHARARAAASWAAPDYLAVESRLRALRDAWRSAGIPVRFVFTLVPDAGAKAGALYCVDAEEDGPEKSKPGEEIRFFERDGGAVDWGTPAGIRYKDAYGTFVSGFAPARGPDGKVALVAGVDLDAGLLDDEALATAWQSAWPVAALGLVLLWPVARLSRAVAAPVEALEATAERLASGEPLGAPAVRAAGGASAVENALTEMRRTIDASAQAAAAMADSCARLEPRLRERLAEAREAARRCEEAARRAARAGERARAFGSGAREADDDVRATVECSANALGEVVQIDAGVQAVIVRGRDLAEHLEAMRGRAATVDAALEAMVQVANRSSVLSLNAEIEASQAGDAGRGFAVVALEIRRLAEQAAANSMEIERNVRALHDALEAGRRATTEFGKAAAEASARSSRLSTAMAEGAQRIEALGPRLRTLGEDGDLLRREGEEISDEVRKAHDEALAVAKFLEAAAPAVAELGRQAAGLRDAASRR